jgi:aspartate carbamoyltransferase regulatory subunit
MTTTRLIEAIKEGTVIDHIPAGQALKIVALLKLKDYDQAVTLGLNLESKRLGRKDLLKISGRFLTEAEISDIAVFAEHAQINTIRDYEVVDKRQAVLPAVVRKILRCPNSRCITQAEAMESRFDVTVTRVGIQLQCHYCEKVFARPDIKEDAT